MTCGSSSTARPSPRVTRRLKSTSALCVTSLDTGLPTARKMHESEERNAFPAKGAGLGLRLRGSRPRLKTLANKSSERCYIFPSLRRLPSGSCPEVFLDTLFLCPLHAQRGCLRQRDTGALHTAWAWARAGHDVALARLAFATIASSRASRDRPMVVALPHTYRWAPSLIRSLAGSASSG